MKKIMLLLRELKPFLPQIYAYLYGIYLIKTHSGDEVAQQICDDSVIIANNWKQYLEKSRPETFNK